ncbi:MAG: NfeD family protein [Prevotellaceae bacterium]|jgi:membrane-bound ClpP family serine protease|nr:NfeD family protein [Prevotellaceae bacterium]
MDITIVLVLLLIGVVFFLIELFFLPGISIAGIAGFLFVAGAIFYAYSFISPAAGHLTLAGSLAFAGISIWLFMKSKMLDKMSLKTDIDAKIEPLKDLEVNVGDRGVAVSRLAPMGKVKVNGHIVEAKTNDDFIDQGGNVIVLEVFRTNILVERDVNE